MRETIKYDQMRMKNLCSESQAWKTGNQRINLKMHKSCEVYKKAERALSKSNFDDFFANTNQTTIAENTQQEVINIVNAKLYAANNTTTFVAFISSKHTPALPLSPFEIFENCTKKHKQR